MTQRPPRPDFFDWNWNALQSRWVKSPLDFTFSDFTQSSPTQRPEPELDCHGLDQWLAQCGHPPGLVVSPAFHSQLKSIYTRLCLTGDTGLIVVEPAIEHAAAQLRQADWRELLNSSYVFWILGPDWEAVLRRWITERGVFQLRPEQCFYLPGNDFAATLQKTFHTGMQDAALKFSQNLKAFVNKPASSTGPLKIWAPTESSAGIYPRITQSLKEGFQIHGCETALSYFGDEWASSFKLRAELVNATPDVLFFINGPSSYILQSLAIPSGWATPHARPRLTWYLDQPRFLASWQRNPYCHDDHAALMDESHLNTLQSQNPKSVFKLPAFASLNRRGTARDELRFPIVYVGSLINIQEFTLDLSPGAHQLLHDLAQWRCRNPTETFDNVLFDMRPNAKEWQALGQCAQRFNQERMRGRFLDDERALEYFVYVVSLYNKRVRMAKRLLPLGLRIFGPNDWLAVVGDAYQERVLGVTSYETLPDIYASAQISINLQSLQCPRAINFRDYDILYAGGFLLSEWVEEFDQNQLRDGTHCVVYHDGESMTEKVEHYLAHPEKRCVIADAGCAEVQARHTGAVRAHLVLEHLRHVGEIQS